MYESIFFTIGLTKYNVRINHLELRQDTYKYIQFNYWTTDPMAFGFSLKLLMAKSQCLRRFTIFSKLQGLHSRSLFVCLFVGLINY